MATSINFDSEETAQAALESSGFSIGTLARDDPRGLMFGDVLISKWRNLSQKDRGELHGIYQRDRRDGPVTVTISRNCPTEGRKALAKITDK